MVEIRIQYEGGLRTQARHMPSGQTLFTDAPVDNQGRGMSFSPTDLVATALGSCMLTIMGIVADRHGWKIEGSEAVVVKRMAAQPTRRIAELAVTLRVRGAVDARARETLERAALGCPVHATLGHALPGHEVSMPVVFEWLD